MFTAMKSFIGEQIGEISDAGLYKAERVITSPQRMHISVADGAEVLNMCANNYLGLADLQRQAYQEGLIPYIPDWGREQISKHLLRYFIKITVCQRYHSGFSPGAGVWSLIRGKSSRSVVWLWLILASRFSREKFSAVTT